MLPIIDDTDSNDTLLLDLDEIARQGAQRMLLAALRAEADAYVERAAGERDAAGHALVVRNGTAQARKVTLGSGTVEVQAPRVHDRRPGHRFTSAILPPWMRRSPKVAEVLPVLYLRGLSTGDFQEALPILLGKEAAGLSATNISRLLSCWEEEYAAWRQRDLADRDYVYVWVDGIHFNIRLEDDRLCTLVMIGVRPNGAKELIAVEDGYRESTESWATLLRDLKRRGMAPPEVAVGDGALGFWAALRNVWPETRGQRCWLHKKVNVLDKLPKRLHGRAKAALTEMERAESRAEAATALQRFEAEFGEKYGKATACVADDFDALCTFFDYPALHWKHLRTTNPVESPFATVRLRQRVTKGAAKRSRGLVMAYKLLDMAGQRWRKLDGCHLLPLVRKKVRFVDGQQVEREAKEIKTRKMPA